MLASQERHHCPTTVSTLRVETPTWTAVAGPSDPPGPAGACGPERAFYCSADLGTMLMGRTTVMGSRPGSSISTVSV